MSDLDKQLSSLLYEKRKLREDYIKIEELKRKKAFEEQEKKIKKELISQEEKECLELQNKIQELEKEK